jgi:hypothetical protein
MDASVRLPQRWCRDVNRRHQSKGALAIAVARMYPEPERQGRGRKALVSKAFPILTPTHISQARTILRRAPDLAEQVEKGRRSPCFNAVSQYLAELRKLEEAGPDH